ncbi:hypothetical protein DYB32_005907 [Aphanomyces invadans]|uniref:Uncharacterized protein n=1 Tax=Aphanomyces invadans TaxID=157072 RepID=A0A3R6Z2P1_9STRA|nr:hypothetical protein DYB32_005907 [Aphanomyces invadans]
MAAPQFPLDPALAALIIVEYDGDRNANHCFHGHGHATFVNGQVYEGEFCDGRMHGRGRLEWPDGVMYEGDFEYNEISGQGRYLWPDESWYEGAVKGGKRHGHGFFQSSNKITTYEGEWMDGKQHGVGRMVYDEFNGIEYDGEWKAGVRDGHGTMKYGSGNVYEGEWMDDKQHGYGVHVWKASEKRGNRYEGEFADGVRDGYGIFHYANGARYEGHWDANVKNGLGLFFFEDGTIYEGAVLIRDPFVHLIQNERRAGEFVHDRMVDLNDNRKQSSAEAIPTILLYVDDLLRGDERERAKGLKAAQNAVRVLRVNTDLRNVYRHYASCAGTTTPYASSENNVLMEMRELWRFAVECRLNASMGKLNRKLLVVRNAQNKAVKRLRIQRERKEPIEALEIQVHSTEMQTVFNKYHESLEKVYVKYVAKDVPVASSMMPENDMALSVRSFIKILQDFGVMKEISIRDALKAIRKASEVEMKECHGEVAELSPTPEPPAEDEPLDPFAMDADMIYPEFLENLTKIALVICPRNLPLPVITAQFIKSKFDDVLFPKQENRRRSTMSFHRV